MGKLFRDGLFQDKMVCGNTAPAQLGNKKIGDIVMLNVNPGAREFIVVHKGKPSSIYDDSFNNGVILLMKGLYESRQWHSSLVNDYANSNIHNYLNGTFLNLFDQNIKDAMVQVKIPYRLGANESNGVKSGANGLSCKIFLAAQIEVSSNGGIGSIVDGATWDYFAGLTYDSPQIKRVAYHLSGYADRWWLRSPIGSNGHAFNVTHGGYAHDYYACGVSMGIRPALVLPASYSLLPTSYLT